MENLVQRIEALETELRRSGAKSRYDQSSGVCSFYYRFKEKLTNAAHIAGWRKLWRSAITAPIAGTPERERHLQFYDPSEKIKFLVDTGAEVWFPRRLKNAHANQSITICVLQIELKLLFLKLTGINF
ncbi:hypothetical protein HC762_01820 [bacterium]|nr:hypothetical protein [bacterium]